MTKIAKAVKTEKTVKAAKTVRVSNGRKEIQASLRALTKIGKAFTKATATLESEGSTLTGEVKTQMAQVLAQLNIASTVTQSEIETKANALARTFIGK